MTLETIKKRLIQLEKHNPMKKWERVMSWDYEQYEDFLVEAKKMSHRPGNEIVAIGIVPQADELRTCLTRMEAANRAAAGHDEELIETVRNQLHQRMEEETCEKNRMKSKN